MDLPKSISDLQNGLKDKSYSAVDLVDSYLARINTFDKDLNSFLTISDDYAYEKAKGLDSYLADNGESVFSEKPLLGSVVALKDIFLTKGIRTTAASKVLENYIPVYSATVVEKLENAGAIVIGKLNLDAWAHGSSGENSDFGATKNPWNKEYVSGGSSSGSAAAVAANFCTFSTATDTCGSTRLPASFCGLVGLKPTYGSVSRYGVISMASSLDTMGHITRNVSDSRRIYSVTSGFDQRDSTLVQDPTSPKGSAGARKLRIGIPKEFFIDGVDSEVRESVMAAAKKYESLGIELVEVSLPSTKYGIEVYYIIQPAEVSSNLGRFDGIRYGNSRDVFGAEAKRRIMLGTYVLSSGYYDAYYLKAMQARSMIIDEVNKVFGPSADAVDALIAPVAPTAAFKLGEKVNDPLKMYLTDIFAATANLAGIPAISIPNGLSKDGLPLGFQLMAPRFGENMLFDLGELYQNNTDFHLKSPSL